jgi:hypothetical protein
MGVVWTFGATRLLIGHLNVATGFLFTIIGGNGINFGIIYMSRFLEVRRRGGSLLEGVTTAHRETWLPTLTAGAAASAAYGSLLLTEFRGFQHFGTIGAMGMGLCWLATYLALPAILAVIERVSPIEDPATEAARPGMMSRLRRLAQGGIAYGAPFAAVVARAPRVLTLGGIALAVLGAVATVRYARSDPMEYDLTKLRVDARARTEEIRLTRLADRITGYVGSDGMAILLRRADQVAPLKAALEARRDAAPPGRKPFEAVYTLQDLVPEDQTSKIPVLLALRTRFLAIHQLGAFDATEWERIKTLLPPADLRPFEIADLPEGLARMFTETDGTRGRIVFISPTAGEKIDDARYLFRWADSFRQTVLPGGEVVHGSGRAVIYADIWAAVLSDVPPAVMFSFGATLLVILIAFRAGSASFAVMSALLVGVAWMVGLLTLLGVKLNFLNFIALPITFGIGVDYAVNVVQRYRREGPGGVLVAIQETGGAVILCSLTTTLGYLALVTSMNHAVRSLGVAAVLGEVSCLLAAVLVLPAALLWLDQRRARRGGADLSPPGQRI